MSEVVEHALQAASSEIRASNLRASESHLDQCCHGLHKRRSEMNVDCSAGFDRRHALYRSVVICARLWGRRGEKTATPHAAEYIANCRCRQ